MESANGLRTERLKEELAAMGETAPEPVPDYLELIVTVGTDSTIRLRKTERNLLLAGGVIGGTGNGARGGWTGMVGWRHEKTESAAVVAGESAAGSRCG